jgi:4-amino-4-deoxy-L-arabinose transferase-like glycosyltransferase
MSSGDSAVPTETFRPTALTADRVLILLWGFVVAVGLASRPVMPVDETRYLGVAWEMWHRGDFLLPTLNGLPYSDKPPLLFWLIHLGWAVFGVNELWARLVSPLFGLANLFWTRRLASRLWGSDAPEIHRAPLLLFGMLLWLFFSTALTFDMILTFCVLAALDGVLEARERHRGWLQVGGAIGLGLLAKGPVCLLFVLPPALLAPWWSQDRLRSRRLGWNLRLVGALLVGAVLALAWALPAALEGGGGYEQDVLLHQTTSRILHPSMHTAPWWSYLAMLPVLLLPYSLWPRLWRGLARLKRSQPAVRFLLAATVPAFVLLSAIGSKRPHYLIPMLPPLALLMGHALRRRPQKETTASGLGLPLGATAAIGLLLALIGPLAHTLAASFHLPGLAPWLQEIHPGAGLALCAVVLYLWMSRKPRPGLFKLTVASVGLFTAVHVGVLAVASPAYDVLPVARYLGGVQAAGHPVAVTGRYQGEFQFGGRLTRPLEVLPDDPAQARAWLADHPMGHVTLRFRDAPPPELGTPEYRQAYRGQWLAVYSSDAMGDETLGSEPEPAAGEADR